MARGKGSRALANCYIVWAGFTSAERTKTGGWLANLSGSIQANVTATTTHVVASNSAWTKGSKVLDAAIDENENRDNKKAEIKIVSYTWAEDCAYNKVKKSEGPYLCEKIWVAYKGDGKPTPGKPVANDGFGPRSHAGLLKEAVLESTEQHVDERARNDLQKEIKRLEKERKIEEQMRQQDEEEARMQGAQIFQRGAKKARNDLFTGEWCLAVKRPVEPAC